MLDLQKIKELRKGLRLNQSNIADSCNIAEAYYSEIETGKKTPSLRTSVAIAKALGVSVNDLLLNPTPPSAEEPGADAERTA